MVIIKGNFADLFNIFNIISLVTQFSAGKKLFRKLKRLFRVFIYFIFFAKYFKINKSKSFDQISLFRDKTNYLNIFNAIKTVRNYYPGIIKLTIFNLVNFNVFIRKTF